jgi:hypothetical protein
MRVGNGLQHFLLPLSDTLYPDIRDVSDDHLRTPFLVASSFCPYPQFGFEYEPYLGVGTLLINDEGCGRYWFLVITGDTAGKVWVDDIVNSDALCNTGQTFLDYLDDHLQWYLSTRLHRAS